jgi:hypothetical protein
MLLTHSYYGQSKDLQTETDGKGSMWENNARLLIKKGRSAQKGGSCSREGDCHKREGMAARREIGARQQGEREVEGF